MTDAIHKLDHTEYYCWHDGYYGANNSYYLREFEQFNLTHVVIPEPGL